MGVEIKQKNVFEIKKFLLTKNYLCHFFQKMVDEELDELISGAFSCFYLYYRDAQNLIFSYNEITSTLYFVYNGSLQILKPSVNRHLSKFAPEREDSFRQNMEVLEIILKNQVEGDIAILNNQPLRSTCVTNEPHTEIIAIRVSGEMQSGLQQYILNYFHPSVNNIRSLFIFDDYSYLKFITIVKYFRPELYQKGDYIIKQDDEIDNFVYILIEGGVVLTKEKEVTFRELKDFGGFDDEILKNKSIIGNLRTLLPFAAEKWTQAKLKAVDCFGDDDILNSKKRRSYSVTVDSAYCTIMKVPFDIVIDPHYDGNFKLTDLENRKTMSNERTGKWHELCEKTIKIFYGRLIKKNLDLILGNKKVNKFSSGVTGKFNKRESAFNVLPLKRRNKITKVGVENLSHRRILLANLTSRQTFIEENPTVQSLSNSEKTSIQDLSNKTKQNLSKTSIQNLSKTSIKNLPKTSIQNSEKSSKRNSEKSPSQNSEKPSQRNSEKPSQRNSEKLSIFFKEKSPIENKEKSQIQSKTDIHNLSKKQILTFLKGLDNSKESVDKVIHLIRNAKNIKLLKTILKNQQFAEVQILIDDLEKSLDNKKNVKRLLNKLIELLEKDTIDLKDGLKMNDNDITPKVQPGVFINDGLGKRVSVSFSSSRSPSNRNKDEAKPGGNVVTNLAKYYGRNYPTNILAKNSLSNQNLDTVIDDKNSDNTLIKKSTRDAYGSSSNSSGLQYSSRLQNSDDIYENSQYINSSRNKSNRLSNKSSLGKSTKKIRASRVEVETTMKSHDPFENFEIKRSTKKEKNKICKGSNHLFGKTAERRKINTGNESYGFTTLEGNYNLDDALINSSNDDEDCKNKLSGKFNIIHDLNIFKKTVESSAENKRIDNFNYLWTQELLKNNFSKPDTNLTTGLDFTRNLKDKGNYYFEKLADTEYDLNNTKTNTKFFKSSNAVYNKSTDATKYNHWRNDRASPENINYRIKQNQKNKLQSLTVKNKSDLLAYKSKTPNVTMHATRKGNFDYDEKNEKYRNRQIMQKSFKEKWNIDDNAGKQNLYVFELDKERNMNIAHSINKPMPNPRQYVASKNYCLAVNEAQQKKRRNINKTCPILKDQSTGSYFNENLGSLIPVEGNKASLNYYKPIVKKIQIQLSHDKTHIRNKKINIKREEDYGLESWEQSSVESFQLGDDSFSEDSFINKNFDENVKKFRDRIYKNVESTRLKKKLSLDFENQLDVSSLPKKVDYIKPEDLNTIDKNQNNDLLKKKMSNILDYKRFKSVILDENKGKNGEGSDKNLNYYRTKNKAQQKHQISLGREKIQLDDEFNETQNYRTQLRIFNKRPRCPIKGYTKKLNPDKLKVKNSGMRPFQNLSMNSYPSDTCNQLTNKINFHQGFSKRIDLTQNAEGNEDSIFLFKVKGDPAKIVIDTTQKPSMQPYFVLKKGRRSSKDGTTRLSRIDEESGAIRDDNTSVACGFESQASSLRNMALKAEEKVVDQENIEAIKEEDEDSNSVEETKKKKKYKKRHFLLYAMAMQKHRDGISPGNKKSKSKSKNSPDNKSQKNSKKKPEKHAFLKSNGRIRKRKAKNDEEKSKYNSENSKTGSDEQDDFQIKKTEYRPPGTYEEKRITQESVIRKKTNLMVGNTNKLVGLILNRKETQVSSIKETSNSDTKMKETSKSESIPST